jgi:hypothetical protein
MIKNENVEKIETSLNLQGRHKNIFKCLCDTIIAKRKNAEYCYEYLKRYKQKKEIQKALYFASENCLYLAGNEFDYNVFNRSIFWCVFYSLIGNNISRIDNLEGVMFELFPQKLSRYDDRKEFSFYVLCKDFPEANIATILKPLFAKHSGLKNIQKLRNQMIHASVEDILHNDTLLHEEDAFYVNQNFTLSGNTENVIEFSRQLNDLLIEIENNLFVCLLNYGQDCLK